MLCLNPPNEYPVINAPVQKYLTKIGFKAPRRASEGAAYIAIATELRSAIRQNPRHLAKNLAELDVAIWS
jgi:hypothetical protein